MIRVTARVFKTRRAVNSAMEFARYCDCFERYNFTMDMGRFNSIRSGTIMFLTYAQWRSQCIGRYGREGIRDVARASRAAYLTKNITIRATYRCFQLINCSASDLTIGANRASSGILNVINVCFRGFTIVSSNSSGFVRVMDLIEVIESSIIRIIVRAISQIFAFSREDFFRIILQRRTSRFTSRLWAIFFHVSYRINRAKFNHVCTYTAWLFLYGIFTYGYFCGFQADRRRMAYSTNRSVRIYRNEEMGHATNA